MADDNFADAVAVVTGGESGIGAACAEDLARAGARVVLSYHADRDAAEATVERCAGGGNALAVQADVSDEAAVEALFVAAEQAFGPVTQLVNSAGLNMRGTMLVDMELAQFDRVVRTDLYGPFLTCRRFARPLVAAGKRGRIVTFPRSTNAHRAPARSITIPPRAVSPSSPPPWRSNWRRRASRSMRWRRG